MVAAREKVAQGSLQAVKIKVFPKQPISNTVPKAYICIIIGILALLNDVITTKQFCLEFVPIYLCAFFIQLEIQKSWLVKMHQT